MGKAVAAVGTAIVIGGLALATGGLALIPAVAGGGLAGALGTAAFGLTAGQWIAVGAGLSAVGSALSAQPAGSSREPLDWVANVDEPIPFAFGRVGVAGKIVYASDGYGRDNRYTSIVSVLSGAGPIKSFVSFASNDIVTSLDPTTGEATSGEHTNEMWVQRKVGVQPDTALSSPAGLDGGATVPLWGATYELSGKACCMQTLFENSKFSAFPGGEEKPLHIIEGKYGWDPRLDSTWPGGSGTCRLLDPSTWVYIDEGCMAGLNWAIGMWEGSDGEVSPTYGVPYTSTQVGGIGASLDAIDVEAFIDCANVADANGWKVAAWPDTGMDESVVLDKLLQASGAMRSRVAGKISCVTRAASQASILTVTGADTAGPVELSLGPSRLDRKNTVVASYWSEGHGCQMTPIEEISDAAWVAADRGKKRSSGIAFSYVPDPDQAAVLAYLHLADLREPVSGTVPFKPHMRRLAPGDCFTFTEAGFRLDGLKCRVLKRAFDPATGVVKITFRQETDAKYTDAYLQTGVAPATPTPAVPIDRTPTTPGVLDWSVSPRAADPSGAQQSGIVITGAAVGDNIGSVQFEVGPTSAGPWEQVYFGPDTTEGVPVNGLKGGEDYYVAVTNWSLKGKPSVPLVQGPYTVPGLVADTFVDAGALAVLDSVDWTATVDNRPLELTDGRVSTALDASGLLQTALPLATANASDLLRTPGGALAGALAVLDEADTAQITPNAVTNYASASTATVQTLTGTTPKKVAELTYVSTGGRLEIKANFFMTVWHPAAGDIEIQTQIKRTGVGNVFDLVVPAIGGDLYQGWQTPTVVETLAAGSYTYEVWVTLNDSRAATQEVVGMVLSVREEKR